MSIFEYCFCACQRWSDGKQWADSYAVPLLSLYVLQHMAFENAHGVYFDTKWEATRAAKKSALTNLGLSKLAVCDDVWGEITRALIMQQPSNTNQASVKTKQKCLVALESWLTSSISINLPEGMLYSSTIHIVIAWASGGACPKNHKNHLNNNNNNGQRLRTMRREMASSHGENNHHLLPPSLYYGGGGCGLRYGGKILVCQNFYLFPHFSIYS